MNKMKTLTCEQVENLFKNGVFKDVQIVDSSIKHVVVTVDGKDYFFSSNYSSINVAQQEPDKIEEKFVVAGKLFGTEILPRHFDEKYEAEEYVDSVKHQKDTELTVNKIKWNLTKGEKA